MQLHRRFLALAATATLLAGASACGDGEKAEPAPSAAATTTAPATSEPAPSTTAPPARPDVPAPDPADFPGKDERTEEGAQQAFRYFWAVNIWSLETGDDSLYEPLFGPECKPCKDSLEQIREVDADGRYWSKTELLDDGTFAQETSLHELEIGYRFTIAAHTERIPGGEPQHFEDVKVVSVGGMSWQPGGWRVDAYTIQPAEDVQP
ncbi:DUF6318 family protein [Brachybacterium sp. JHP9]|uniref:DUF6318 family protein n=1 Tax=Brachybacterium equifaecis TaxID=2910770 RepID=A0ABT0QY52_9MICO|nr:DUF6318 family protein [Brachybacterium equifaecis]MCL6422546.1 DUF6318 family protein [Brachybacterium equifaecis]